MKKSEITKKKIYEYIKSNPGKSSTQISDFLGITSVAILYHLQNLIKDKYIYKTGNTRRTRYFIVEKKSNIDISNDFFVKIKKDLIEEYNGIDNIDILYLLNNLLAYLKADGTREYGFQAFIEKIIRENKGSLPDENLLYRRLYSFLISFFEEERKRRKNGFFDGTESLKIIMSSYNMNLYIP